MDRRELLKFIGLASVGGLVTLPTMTHADVLAEQRTAAEVVTRNPPPGGRYAPRTLAELLEDCGEELPNGVDFYRDAAGNICWPVYVADAGHDARWMAYLVSEINVADMTPLLRQMLGVRPITGVYMYRTAVEFTFFDFALTDDPRSAEQVVRHKVKAALTKHLAKCA